MDISKKELIASIKNAKSVVFTFMNVWVFASIDKL